MNLVVSGRIPGRPRRGSSKQRADIALPRWVVRNTAVRAQRPGLGGRMPVRWQRRYLDAAAGGLPCPPGTAITTVDLAGFRAERVTVGATERPRAVLYLHGGAFMVGSPASHRSLAAHLAEAAQAVIFTLDYPLAPEHPYPAALDATVAAYRALRAQGWAPEHLVIAGDSAGGGLAVAAAQLLAADDPAEKPAALALISPAVDVRAWGEPISRRKARLDPVVRLRWAEASRLAYVGTGDEADPGITPTLGKLDVLPPTIVHVDRDEILHDRVVDFVGAAQAAGVDVTAHEYVRTWHVMHAHAAVWQVAADAVRELGAYVRTHS